MPDTRRPAHPAGASRSRSRKVRPQKTSMLKDGKAISSALVTCALRIALSG
jgi:hypothetical protein